MTDLTSLQADLDKKRQELSRLELELRSAQEERLKGLAQELGFDSTNALIIRLAQFASAELRETIQSFGGTARAATQAAPSKPRRRRARITAELRKRIASEIRANLKTALEIADEFDVSSSFVNQFKRQLGMTRPGRSRRRRAGNDAKPAERASSPALG